MKKPVFFNVFRIQMPVGAVTSITHRVTGVLLAVGIPLGIYLFSTSLDGPEGYARVGAFFDAFAVRCAAVVFAWALAHHLLAGLRHMLGDVDIGSRLAPARRSAWAVNLLAVLIAALAAAVWL
ncbi:succinate dehydrogenase, cytochrome b556 subunit [Parapusillimonas granuli]|uniref:Succinate dehydrogenase cytochrome b556 subunit n=1 Tax=Parapusillimonas granuli TaxID=380911 RepID=A0A853FXE1_9BURK|nr:succinate dehydrogenase, cytochrome b556 subunit [Parapusillimonas granuli]MBB5214951.1 succinate dehydrogenase / fumarate reductase cytochrome b subunit [Parapusillimonas granuli]MEB2401190.1 succinate dehydrogenase, cytochrome b556 subunit [Alcaligenaceae bacterium]NYT49273.1 succinate dehydrogenase, cytochrome b556 subunit [Parapusillimonas granuli]